MNHPLTIVVFGATGDLFKKKLAKVFFDIYEKGILPIDTEVIGISRKPLTDHEWRDFIKEILNRESFTKEQEEFFSKFFYLPGDIKDAETFKKLSKRLGERDEKIKKCSNKLFYLAVFPALYQELFEMISHSGLAIPCAPGFEQTEGWIKILVEKPFGENATEAKKLDLLLGTLFLEDQIFRVDHYLAKETIQNLLVFRFANPLFEALWCSKHIKSVSVKMFEEHSVKERGSFYDKIGALKDVGQNHLLSLLSLVAMEMPKEFSAEAIRSQREKVLSKIKVKDGAIRAQYDGYKEESGVEENSETETYFKANLKVDNKRWNDVDFIIEHGKGFSKTEASIEITYFENIPGELFMGTPNKLIFEIQPKEKIEIEFSAKKPGFGFEIEKQYMQFHYKEDAVSPFIYPYEKLFLDALAGDQTLFVSTGEMKEAWRIVSDVEENMKRSDLKFYTKGIDKENIE
ncbi:MAG: glucose-6-phosphate dehydrogenase [Candidatus Paceibacterota bacterium]